MNMMTKAKVAKRVGEIIGDVHDICLRWNYRAPHVRYEHNKWKVTAMTPQGVRVVIVETEAYRQITRELRDRLRSGAK